MDSTDQAKSQAWSLWTKLAAPALLRCPVLGISAVLVVSTPLAAMARMMPRIEGSASAEPTQRQLHVLRSYERYLARMRAQTIKAGRAVKFAYRQVGKPYQWGGAGPRTYDCSGLVMAAWRKGGLRLPHRADLQHRMIRRKVSLARLRPGDLVFFSGDHHVGIYVGHRHFLHAPHTGARVQRGTLTGWRLRAFAGAARPAAPAYHAWPHWVRSLAAHSHASPHNAATAHQSHGPGPMTFPDDPGVTRPDDAPPVESLPESGDGADDQASGVGLDPVKPPIPAAAPQGAEKPVPSAPQGAEKPVPSAPQGAVGQPAHAPEGAAIPQRALAVHAGQARRHAVPADSTPVPRPEAPAAARPTPHSPRDSVRQRNDEQRFDRDYDDTGGADDGDSGNDGIDLRSLLGGAL